MYDHHFIHPPPRCTGGLWTLILVIGEGSGGGTPSKQTYQLDGG